MRSHLNPTAEVFTPRDEVNIDEFPSAVRDVQNEDFQTDEVEAANEQEDQEEDTTPQTEVVEFENQEQTGVEDQIHAPDLAEFDQLPRRSTREKHKPDYYGNVVTHLAQHHKPQNLEQVIDIVHRLMMLIDVSTN